MGNRPNLYVVAAALFPIAFAGFVIGFGCPVWRTNSTNNVGLWQNCAPVVKNCSTLNFDEDGDWMIGVRAVEIFALTMLVSAGLHIIFENCNTNFKGRSLAERLATSILCILGGFGGLAGIITYAVKAQTAHQNVTYGWALALVAAGSGLAVILGVGFCLSGAYFEHHVKEKDVRHLKGMNNELNAYSNNGFLYDDHRIGMTSKDNLPGYAVYNGPLGHLGQRNSLAGESMFSAQNALPPYGNKPPIYSENDERMQDTSFDLSEGYKAPQPRSARTMDFMPAMHSATPSPVNMYNDYRTDGHNEQAGRNKYLSEETTYRHVQHGSYPNYNDGVRLDRDAYRQQDHYSGMRF